LTRALAGASGQRQLRPAPPRAALAPPDRDRQRHSWRC